MRRQFLLAILATLCLATPGRSEGDSPIIVNEGRQAGEPAPRTRPDDLEARLARLEFVKPTAEEALAFLRTWPMTWGGKDKEGNVIWVQPWQKRTVEDIRTMTTLHPGYHLRSGAMWRRGEPVGPERKALPKFIGKMHTRLDPSDYRYFAAFEKLEKFEATHDLEDLDDECLFYLGHLSQSVQTLRLEMIDATGVGVRYLQDLKHLKTLTMNLSRTITDVALVNAAGIASLERLEVGSCPAITGSGVSALARLKNLKALKIGSCSLSDASLANFRDLAIEELDLSHTEMGWAIEYRGGGHAKFTVTLAGLRALIADRKNMPHLKRLILTDPKIRANLLTPASLTVTKAQKAELAQLRPGLEVR
ncbi:MAG: hypothetical protein BIFFINMI_01473 [Phycisphaerae bacterium]|nr:hypothetical protein [Phycisphaerae bacterium]